MEFAAHTYGPSCILHHDSNADVHRPLDAPPPLKSFFFYSSLLPIDDPLSPLPPPSASVNARLPIRPFSAYDNAMLEEAWRGLDTTPKSGNTPLAPPPGEQGPSSEPQPSLAIDDYNDKRGSRILSSRQKKKRKLSQTSGGDVVEDLQHGGKRGLGLSFPQPSSQGTVTPAYPLRSKSGSKASKKARDTSPRGGDEERFEHRDVTSQTVMPERNFMAGSGLESAGSSFGIGDEGASSRKSKNTLHGDIEQSSIMQFQQEPTPDEPALLCDYPNHERDQDGPVTLDELESEVSLVKKGKQPQFSKDKPNKKTPSPRDLNPIEITSPLALPQTKTVQTAQIPYGSSPAERDTTGNPFQRALSRPKVPRFLKTKALQQKDGPSSESEDDPEQLPQHLSALLSSRGTRHAYTPVGVSRLHLVEMPELEMKPIYWSPVHDISAVVRGTWFFKTSMLPVDSDLANMLEKGFQEMMPWTRTYSEEVDSCLEIGPEAELKLVHKIWPSEEPETSEMNNLSTSSPPLDDGLTFVDRAAGSFDIKSKKDDPPIRLFARSSVIYANDREAQILRPSQLPSVSRGRRPLGSIRKSRMVGEPVIRGFDTKAWDKIYGTKRSAELKRAEIAAEAARLGATATFYEPGACPACVAAETTPKVTDLILVIHGIGQKLSERVESFHFTHSINAMRREMAIELASDTVKPVLRDNLGGVMILPVNWRSTLSLEDGGSAESSESKDAEQIKDFTLKDITVGTIPAIRNLMSDVMFDIPYYLSHHKPKMMEAVIKEANRIYRLWCRNNPGFDSSGRMHLVAHSLGSIMALDILSKQPTKIPESINLRSGKVSGSIFEFDTKNLFICGSPAGFFLLLNKARLTPRNGRQKPGLNKEDVESGVGGETGTYGCLAVDNVYNVMHPHDPVAYRLNACVDVDYSSTLEIASVPSSSVGWITSLFRGRPAPMSRPPRPFDTQSARPSIAKLPSSMEMEVHNFSLEEIAEKKMHLLNDNGQIDYYLSSGGGPLEIQYLNMLSAHSSYWVLRDFIRFLVVEVGRKPGRDETMLAMRAVKKGYWKQQQGQK